MLMCILDDLCPAHLSRVITDQLMFLYNYNRARKEGLITYQDFICMIGRLYSCLLRAIKDRGYRLRLFVHHNSDDQLYVKHAPLRIFGCLSLEHSTFETNLNRSFRLSNFRLMHKVYNLEVTFI